MRRRRHRMQPRMLALTFMYATGGRFPTYPELRAHRKTAQEAHENWATLGNPVTHGRSRRDGTRP